MRNNQPVNTTEHRMKSSDVLVSKTDLKGKITYANEDFCEIAGMTEEALIGQPHNVVRHPDMPPEAFEDLWQTLKAGKPWTGYVKNRSADGGFYWVHACVAPEFDNQGHAIGYISVRTCPTDAEIKQAETLYDNVNLGKEKLASTLHFSWFNRIKIKTQLIAVSVLATVTLLALLWMVYGDLSKTITKDEMHLKGLEYVVAIRNVMEALPQHRGMTNAYLHGNTKLLARLRAKQDDVNKAFALLLQVGQRYNQDFPVLGKIKKINKEWSNLSSRWQQMSAKESFSKHNALASMLLGLSSDISVVTQLLSAESIVESMSARFLAMQSLKLTEYMGRLRGLGTGLAAKGEVNDVDKEKLIALNGSVALLLEQAVLTVKKAIETSTMKDEYEVNFTSILNEVQRNGQEFSDLVKNELIDKKHIEISSDDYFDAGSKAIASILTMFDVVEENMVQHLTLTVEEDSSTLWSTLVITGVAILLIISLLVYTTMMIATPLEWIRSILQKIVRNDYSTLITKQQNNEMGDVLDLIEVMQSRLQFEIFEAKKTGERQKALDAQRKEKERHENLSLANTFESEVGSLVISLSENASSVYQSMEQLSQIADGLNQQSEDAQSSVTQSSDYVGSTAAAIEEMSISVASVVEQITETLDISKQAVHEANNSATIMQELVTASEEIGSVVATINDIAEQTNLLALNASIEAARAGDAGRGFAVVAGEVKELASQTSQATGQIRSKVEHIQKQSSQAGDAIAKIHDIIGEVNQHSSHVAAAMDEQNAAINEMSSGAQYANSSMQEAQHSVGEVSSSATTVDDSAEANLKLINNMIDDMSVVQNQVQGFVTRLKG